MTIEPLTIVEVNEAEAKGIIQHNETPVILEKTPPSDSQRVKKQSRQESVVDSEGIPDIVIWYLIKLMKSENARLALIYIYILIEDVVWLVCKVNIC